MFLIIFTVITLDDNDLNGASTQNISSLLTAGRDPFYNAATFNFSATHFRIRGYDADYISTYINGIPMDNLDNGYTPFGLWGGLNDVFKNRDINFGIRYNTFAFGDIGNTTNIDVRASKQKPQTNFGYAFSNRSYTHKISFTHSTGLNKNGWAFTIAASWRYADEGYVPGTYFNGYSWFAAIDKKLGQKQILSLIAFACTNRKRKARRSNAGNVSACRIRIIIILIGVIKMAKKEMPTSVKQINRLLFLHMIFASPTKLILQLL